MQFKHIRLQAWRNFLAADVDLPRRVFLVGPNAAGKSNFLDAFKFLRDIADPHGGFQRAVSARRGVSQIRSLHARRYPDVMVDVRMTIDDEDWRYRLEFNQDNQRAPVIRRELVEHNGECLLDRPNPEDKNDKSRLSQTHLEQVNSNQKFRTVTKFLSQVRYLHLVPQLVKEPIRSGGRVNDPYGGDFLEQIASTTEKIRRSRLKRINETLRLAVPQLKDLRLERDEKGVPHLRGLYEHWRPNAGWQTEDQFSDGTLRLLGLLWVLLDGSAPLLLEEPELSLHSEVVRYIPQMLARLNRRSGRQVIVSTHSADMLADSGIPPEEVLMLVPSNEDTKVERASEFEDIVDLLQHGSTIADAVLPKTAPKNAAQLALFGE